MMEMISFLRYFIFVVTFGHVEKTEFQNLWCQGTFSYYVHT